MRFNLGFFLSEAFKNIRLNLLMTLTAVTTTFICILVLGLGLLVSDHIQGIIGSVREDVSVEVFPPNASKGDIDDLANKVKDWPEVSEVTRVSEEEAFAEFKDQFKDQPALYEDLDQGVLPASVQIQLKDPGTANEVARQTQAGGLHRRRPQLPAADHRPPELRNLGRGLGSLRGDAPVPHRERAPYLERHKALHLRQAQGD